MKYLVLFTDQGLSSDPIGELTYVGQFSTLKEAEASIRKEAAGTAADAGGFGGDDADTWGGRYTILQTVKTVTPVPSVKITLKEVEE